MAGEPTKRDEEFLISRKRGQTRGKELPRTGGPSREQGKKNNFQVEGTHVFLTFFKAPKTTFFVGCFGHFWFLGQIMRGWADNFRLVIKGAKSYIP